MNCNCHAPPPQAPKRAQKTVAAKPKVWLSIHVALPTNEHVQQVKRIPKSIKFWKDLNLEQKKILKSKFVVVVIFYCYLHTAVAQGKQALEKYITRWEPIPFYLCQWARREAAFMPDFVSYSRELALMCLTTRVRNILCLYHSRHTSSKYSNDHALSNKRAHIKVTGVAYPQTAVSKQVKEEDEDEDEDDNDNIGTGNEVKASKALHCGCWTNDALLDFYLWKCTHTESPSTRAIEGWKEDLLEPCQRVFVSTAFTAYSGLDVDSLYEVDSHGKRQDTEELVRIQIEHIIDTGLSGLQAEAFKKKHNL